MIAFAAVLTVAIWTYLLFFRGGFWRPRESPVSDNLSHSAPRIAVVIPARDEAAVIGQAVASLGRQDYGGELRIVVVDDHSSDATARIARNALRDRPELLTVAAAAPLPPGWTGKLWAVSEGVRQATAFRPAYFLFTDADILHDSHNLSTLVALAEHSGYDIVSFMVKLKCRSFAERALIPAFVFFFFKLYPPRWIEKPRRNDAGAAGGCLLIRASALDRIGGVASIRGAIIDDCALAREVKRTGGKIWLGMTRHTESIRDYATFGEIERMIARTAFTQLKHSVLLLFGTVLGMVTIYLLPLLLLLSARPIARMAGACAWAMMTIAFAPVLRFYKQSILWAPALPVIAVFYLGATIHSAILHWRGQGGMWKGRVSSAMPG